MIRVKVCASAYDPPADVLLEDPQRFLQSFGGRAHVIIVLLGLHGEQAQLVLQALDGLLHTLKEGCTETT